MLKLTPEQQAVIARDPTLSKQYTELMGIEAGLSDLRKVQGGLSFLLADWQHKPHPKQEQFFNSAKPMAMFSGAQGSGKTTILANIAAAIALGRHPTIKIEPPVSLWLVGLSYTKVEQVLLPLFRKALPHDAILSWDAKSYQMKVRHDSGAETTVGFMSAEADVEKFQSNRLDAILFDEAPPKDRGTKIFRECQSRFKPGRTLYIRLAGTPWELSRYFRDQFAVGSKVDPDNVDCIVVGLIDNPYVPSEQVAFQATKYNGKELRARIYGEFVSLTGQVFDTIDPSAHICEDFEIPQQWPIYCGIDPTEGRRPWTIVWLAVAPNGDHYVFKELEVSGTYENIVSAILSKEGFETPQYRAIDPFASKFNMKTGTDWRTELLKLGLTTKVVDRSKRTLFRSYANQLLGDPALNVRPRLQFFRRGAERAFQSFMNHEWSDWDTGDENKALKESEQDDSWKDFVDALLYLLSFKPRYFSVEDYKLKKKLRRMAEPAVLDATVGY